MHLLHHASLDHLLFVSLVLALNFLFHILALVLLHPLAFSLELFLQLNILLAISINILKKVDAGLIFTIPLLFTVLPLFSILLCNKFVNHLFIRLFVEFLFKSELLKFDGLNSVALAFLVFKLLDCLLALKSSIQQLQVALFFRKFCLLSQQLFLLVVLDQSQIAFTD